MKKILSVSFVILLSIPLLAQKGAFVGLRVMPQSAWILNTDDFDSDVFDFGIPFSVAFSAAGGYMFSDMIGAEVQVMYSPQGQKYVDDDKNDLATIKNNYLKIPVLLRLRTKGEKVAFLLNVGPQFSFLMKSSIISEQGESGPPFGDDTRDYYENFELSVALGIGTSIALAENVSLDLMIKIDYGLSEIESDLGKYVLSGYEGGRASSNNALAGFSIGVNYAFPTE